MHSVCHLCSYAVCSQCLVLHCTDISIHQFLFSTILSVASSRLFTSSVFPRNCECNGFSMKFFLLFSRISCLSICRNSCTFYCIQQSFIAVSSLSLHSWLPGLMSLLITTSILPFQSSKQLCLVCLKHFVLNILLYFSLIPL